MSSVGIAVGFGVGRRADQGDGIPSVRPQLATTEDSHLPISAYLVQHGLAGGIA
jgi:hypothetical protein